MSVYFVESRGNQGSTLFLSLPIRVRMFEPARNLVPSDERTLCILAKSFFNVRLARRTDPRVAKGRRGGGEGAAIGSLGIQEITRCLSDGSRLMVPTETAIRPG